MSFLNEPLLLVPIHVDALAVGKRMPPDTMFQWTNLAPNFPGADNYFFGSELVGDNPGAGTPFDQATGLKPGIHLNFNLPRAFAHGLQHDDGPLTFPRIPNRWLVQRFDSGAATYEAWLIKSDAPAQNSSGTPWAVFPKDEQTPVQMQSIGRCEKLSASPNVADETALVNLTVVGQGDPLFSVYYPACSGVLGFYDALTDVQAGASLSYLVTGWFSDSADDPLTSAAWRAGEVSPDAARNFRAKHNIPDGATLTPEQQSELLAELRDAWLAERQWKCDFEANVAPPARLLCHGLVRGIVWQGRDFNYTQPSTAGSSLTMPEVFPPNADNYRKAYAVGIGHTGGEALAALLATGAVDQDLLAGLQDGLLDQPVTAAELQYELHARRFDGVQGGSTFAVQAEPDDLPTTSVDDLHSSARGQSVVLPKPLDDLLRQLNQKQSECDRLAREIEDCRRQVYALWYLWTTESRTGTDETRIDNLASQLETFKPVLLQTKAELAAAIAARDAIYKAATDGNTATGTIIDELARYRKTDANGSTRVDDAGKPLLKYRVVKSTLPPFYKPSEPVIAVSGPGMVRRHSAERLGPVTCRLSDKIVTGITLHVPGGEDFTVTADALFPSQPTLELLDAANKSLLGEALLLDGAQAATIAGKASQQSMDELTPIVKALQNPASVARSNTPAPPNALVGALPDWIAIFNWQRNPWVPLVMVWEVSWQSDYQTAAGRMLPPNLVTGRWQLDPTGDLTPDSAAPTGAATTYKGHSILSASASLSLAERLASLNDSQPLIDVLKNQNVQLQKLAGFNNALIRQEVGMQIPPLDFQKWFDTGSLFVDSIRTFLNQGFSVADQRDRFRPAPDTTGKPFLPIRSGQLEITRLSIVDAFGQTLLLPVANINQSAGTGDPMLHRADNSIIEESSNGSSAITLRPRFAQPIRLQFNCAASADSGTDAAPVCGWILPNHLENSLTVYDADGKPLGALQKKLGQVSGTTDKTAFYWVDVPGGPNGHVPSTDLDERLAQIIENSHLRYFCSWVLTLSPDDGASFSSLLSAAIASADQRVPDEDPGVSVLVGRPLALVRASLQLEIAGLPAHAPELRANSGTARDLIETNGFENVKWPVRLGDIAARQDGLIGLFECVPRQSGQSVITGGSFYPCWGQDQNLPSNAFATQNFLVDCVQTLEVTLLMDPQARVHATTGVLPRTFFELPHESSTRAKRVREVFFQTAPVLGFSPTPAMPRPSDDYGEWSWAYRPDVTQWKLDPKLIEATYLGGFADAWPTIAEGWLRLAIAPVKVLSFWVREPIDRVAVGTRVHLAWSLQGAESLKLVKVKNAGTTIEPIEQWDAPPFPTEYGVVVEEETTYRVIASTEDAKSDARQLTIKIAEGDS